MLFAARSLAALICTFGMARAALVYEPVASFAPSNPMTESVDGFDSGLEQDGQGNFFGVSRLNGDHGKGFVYRVSVFGAADQLFSFSGADGEAPRAALCRGRDGVFYGTTSAGGMNGQGTIFKITSDGTFTVLHHFAGTEGSAARGRLLLAKDGSFYGTTSAGGGSSAGTLFRMAANGQVSVVHDFTMATGGSPYAGVTEGPDGALYGTTLSDSLNGYGVVYRATPTGDYRILHRFNLLASAANVGKDEGIYPRGELLLSGGVFYGTCGDTLSCKLFGGTPTLFQSVGPAGSPGKGTIFRITKTGAYRSLLSTNGGPTSGLAVGADGAFYGTLSRGGVGGSIFRFVATPKPAMTFLGPAEGIFSTLLRDDGGNLWGTAPGTSDQTGVTKLGTVFVLSAGRLGAKGAYLGRVFDVTQSHAGSGLLRLQLGVTGSFSAKLDLAGKKYAFTGIFDLDGNCSHTISRGAKLPPVVVGMHLNVEDAVVNRVTGNMGAGGSFSNLDLHRVPTYVPRAAAASGRYTSPMSVFGQSIISPNGWATTTVSDKGVLKMAGKFPDLTPFTLSTTVLADGTVPFYLGLYAPTARGSMRGILILTGADGGAGVVYWDRPPQHGEANNAGFGQQDMGIFVSPFHTPESGERILDFGNQSPNGNFSFGSQQGVFAPHPFELFADNSTKFPDGDILKPLLSFNRTTGIITGSFTFSDHRCKFTGVVDQKQNQAFGLWSAGPLAGGVYVRPHP